MDVYCRELVNDVHHRPLSTGQTARLFDLLLLIISVTEIIHLCLRRQYLQKSTKGHTSLMLAWIRHVQRWYICDLVKTSGDAVTVVLIAKHHAELCICTWQFSVLISYAITVHCILQLCTVILKQCARLSASYRKNSNIIRIFV